MRCVSQTIAAAETMTSSRFSNQAVFKRQYAQGQIQGIGRWRINGRHFRTSRNQSRAVEINRFAPFTLHGLPVQRIYSLRQSAALPSMVPAESCDCCGDGKCTTQRAIPARAKRPSSQRYKQRNTVVGYASERDQKYGQNSTPGEAALRKGLTLPSHATPWETDIHRRIGGQRH
jgi:hypothetical protein